MVEWRKGGEVPETPLAGRFVLALLDDMGFFSSPRAS